MLNHTGAADLKFLQRPANSIRNFKSKGGPSVPNPKFASFCGAFRSELRIRRDTGNLRFQCGLVQKFP
jgi:hypothetical protein